ncbi:MAG TPA: membrane protein insertion efficiency factor YidD [Rhizomicrobium sp.]|nr:membrane protein insertion efficiency factor YidD [Rhizomicrobium sp.]
MTDHPTNLRETVRNGASAVLIAPIRFYKRFLSPFLPTGCRYEPTCSVYMMQAIEIHGPLKGLWLGLKRLGRCHPITWLGGSSGYDPVPAARPHNHKHECTSSHG